MSLYKTNKIEDLELIYSILRETNPNRQIEITFNWNTKDYIIKLTNKEYKFDPEVPLDLDVKVIYGDSVTCDTPLLLKKKDSENIYIETISSIFNENKKVEYPGLKIFDKTIRLEKEYSLTDYQVWSDAGWVDIKKVIRHKCEKKIYRVLTHTGCIDVTEDHSLIRDNLEPIKPTEIKIGDSLLHSFPKEFVENDQVIVKMKKNITETKICNSCNIEKDINEFYKNNNMINGRSNKCRNCEYYNKSKHPLKNILKDYKFEDYQLTEKEAEVWGFFQADGSCGSYNCKSGKKSSWALNNKDLKRLNYFKEILERIEPIEFEILDTLESSGVYKLVPKGDIKYIVEKYRNLFYYEKNCNLDCDKNKIVPNCILNGSIEIKKSYWKGYWQGDGAKTGGYSIDLPDFTVKGKIGAQCMYYLMCSMGFKMGINVYNNSKKNKYYDLQYTTFQRKKETEIKKIFELEIDKSIYVYDLETSIGRFGAGVGQMILFNTDSCFLRFKYNRDDFEKNRIDTFKLASLCGDKLTNEIFNRKPIEMEFEKVFQPFILLTKKRYIGKKYEDTRDPFKLKEITTAGIALTRRDYSQMVKKCYREVIDNIMNNEESEAVETYKKYVDKIENYQIEFEDLVVSAVLAKSYSCNKCKEKVEWRSLKCIKCKELNLSRSNNCQKCNMTFNCIHTFSLGHVNLATKLLQRLEEIQVNDRIQYIYIESNNSKDSKYDLAEDPKYAKENKLKYNRTCYLEQLAKPIISFFGVVFKNDLPLLDEIIDYTNKKLENFGGKKLKRSDFKIEEN